MNYVSSVTELEAIYGAPGETALRKVARRLTPEYRDWVARSRFCILSTVGPDGTDGSPRGDDQPVVDIWDDHTVAMPDWRGNNRMDSLRNIVGDPRISMMFMVPGSNNVVRLNGIAKVTVDPDALDRFDRKGLKPRSVIVVHIREVYSQCARALIRSGLWTSGDKSEGLPTVGQILSALTDGDMGGSEYDLEWGERAHKSMW